MEFNPANNNIYVANQGSGTVSVIGGSNQTLLGNTVVGTEPVALEFNPANNNIYVANVVSNSVSIIDSINNDVSETLNVNNVPLALTYNPSNNAYLRNGYAHWYMKA